MALPCRCEVKAGIIIQARLSSRRLPGKVLVQVGDRPLLQHLLDRLTTLAVPLLVATSSEESDTPIAEYCRLKGYPVYRGDLENVAKRLVEAAAHAGFDPFIRVCADSLFIDPQLVRHGLSLFRSGETRLVTNVCPRSYPKGQSVEVIDREFLACAMADFNEPEDFDHVTRYFYRHAPLPGLLNFLAPADYSAEELQVDTFAHLEAAKELLRLMDRPAWSYHWQEVLSMKRRLPLGDAP